MARALEVATPLQVHGHARSLVAQGATDEAVQVFRMNAERHPEVWFTHVGLARAHSAEGDLAAARASLEKALAEAPEAQRAQVEVLLEQVRAGQTI